MYAAVVFHVKQQGLTRFYNGLESPLLPDVRILFIVLLPFETSLGLHLELNLTVCALHGRVAMRKTPIKRISSEARLAADFLVAFLVKAAMEIGK